MIKKITRLALMILMLGIFSKIQSSVVVMSQNQNIDLAEQYYNFKNALLANDQKTVDKLLDQNPELLLYVDPKTGRMIQHDIFLKSYPKDSLMRVLNGLDKETANTKDKNGNRPLHYLFEYSKNYTNQELHDALKYLLEKSDARPLSKNNENVTPLHLVAQMNHPEFLKLVIRYLPQNYKEKGYLDLADNNKKRPLIYAIDAKNEDNVLTLLQNGALFDSNFMNYVNNIFQEN